jgi:hypothetical protein
MHKEQQHTISIRTMFEKEHMFYSYICRSHLHSCCASRVSSGLATRGPWLECHGGNWERLFYGGGRASDFIFCRSTWLLYLYTRRETSMGRTGWSYCACALRIYLFQTHCSPVVQVWTYVLRKNVAQPFMPTILPADFSWRAVSRFILNGTLYYSST